MTSADREEIKAAVQRLFDMGLCCSVEVRLNAVGGGASRRWEPRLLIFSSATPAEALAAVEETLGLLRGWGVRVAGYDPARLTPAPGPSPVRCSPPAGAADARVALAGF